MKRHVFVKKMESVSRAESGVVFHCSTNEGSAIDLELTICTPHIVRLRMCTDPALQDYESLLEVRTEWPAAECEVMETDVAVTVDTGALRFVAQREPWQYRIENADGETLLAEHIHDLDAHANFRSLPLGYIAEGDSAGEPGIAVNETFVWTPGEAIYGFGEKFTRLNKVGQSLTGWNKNPFGAGTEEAYKNIPFFLSTRGYGVFIDTTFPVEYHVASRSLASVTIEVAHPVLELYLMVGPSMKETLAHYASITGFAPLPPLESFGIWHTPQPWVDKTPDQMAAVAEEFRARDIPVDYFMAVTFCSGRIEDDPSWTSAVSDRLRELGVKTGIYIAPLLNVGTKLSQEARENGYALKRADGEPYEIPLGYRTDAGERGEAELSLAVLTRDDAWRDRHNRIFYTMCLMPDFTNPETVRWWKDKLGEHLRAGLFAIGMSDFGEDVPVDAVFHNGRSGLEMHNLYTLLYQKATYEAIEEGSDHRGLVNARSGTAGMQRYPICWSGDPNCTWEDLLADLRAGLGLGLSGVPFWSCDNGGFSSRTGNLTSDLWIRWSQWTMFQSHVRLHGEGPMRVPWLLGEPGTSIFRTYAKLRYRLLPYIYSQAYASTQTGLPMMRALVLEYPDDPMTYEVEDEYLYGDAFLVAPIYSTSGKRSVYLPGGLWFDYWSGEAYEGPVTVRVDAPLDVLPLYVRANSVIPMGPDMAYVGERPFDPITLDVWLGPEGAAACTLFDDTGDGPVTTLCRAQLVGNQVTLEVGPSDKRFVARLRGMGAPKDVSLDGEHVETTLTDEEFDAAETAWMVADDGDLRVKFSGDAGGRTLVIAD